MVDYLSSQPNRAGYQVSTKQGSGPGEISAEYKRLATEAVKAEISYISSRIKHYRFGATPIHLFAVPFLKYDIAGKQRSIKDVRKEMQHRLSVGKRGE